MDVYYDNPSSSHLASFSSFTPQIKLDAALPRLRLSTSLVFFSIFISDFCELEERTTSSREFSWQFKKMAMFFEREIT